MHYEAFRKNKERKLVVFKNGNRKNVSQLKIWVIELVLGTCVILTNLFWNSGLPLFTIARKPSIYYAVLRTFQSYSGIFLNVLLLIMGYTLSKSGKTNMKALVQQWVGMFIISLLMFLVFAFGLKNAGLNGLYDLFFPLLRNVYPLVTGLFLGQLIVPVLKKLLHVYDAHTIFRTVILIGIISTFFNQDIFGLGAGNTAIFGAYMFSLGSLLALDNKAFISHHIKWIVGLFIFSGCLNMLMPFISFGTHINLSSAARFVPNSSALNILLSVFLFDGFKNRLQRMNVNLVKSRQRQQLVLYCIGILMCSTLSRVQRINIGNNNLSFATVPQKFIVVLIESIVISFILCLLTFVMRPLFAYFNLGNKYENLHILQARDVAKADLKRILCSRGFLTICVFYVLAAFSMLIMNDSWTISPSTLMTANIFIYTFFVRQQLIWLNMLVLFAIFAILRFFFGGRYWLAFIITDLFGLIFSVASKIKQGLRQEPILPSDMSEAKNIGSLLGMLDVKLVIFAAIFVILVLVVGTYLELKHKGQNLSFFKRSLYAFLGLFLLGSSFSVNHENTPTKEFLDLLGDNRYFQNQANGGRANGAILQFVNNVDVKIMNRPDGYSKEKMGQISREYNKLGKQINSGRKNKLSDQTIIMALSESFSDPSRVPGLSLNKDPMPYIRSLKKDTTSGLMISGGYGGGTANMEYMALTGFGLSNFSRTLATPYTQLVDNMNVAPSVVQNFAHSTAIHPYEGVYYNRPNVYKKFGFNSFVYLGSKTPIKYQKKIDNSNYLSDYTAYQNTLSQINKHNGGQFINLVTMQNHLPYTPGTYKNNKFDASGKAVLNGSDARIIEEYAMGMYHTDEETKRFIKQLDQVNKPITFVFYGDHLPGNYTGVSMDENELALHQTDYFIYSNKYAREHGYGTKKLKTNSTKIVSPTNFSALTAEQSNSKVNPYLALMTQINRNLPAYGSDVFDKENQFVDSQGRSVSRQKLNKKQKKLLADYRLVQYDMTAGKQYLAQTNFFDK